MTAYEALAHFRDLAAYGRVSLWGRIVEHARGYRAEYAYPYELWAPTKELAASLRETYQVDTTVRPFHGKVLSAKTCARVRAINRMIAA